MKDNRDLEEILNNIPGDWRTYFEAEDNLRKDLLDLLHQAEIRARKELINELMEAPRDPSTKNDKYYFDIGYAVSELAKELS